MSRASRVMVWWMCALAVALVVAACSGGSSGDARAASAGVPDGAPDTDTGCQPTCGGRACGDNGCGGSCGTCLGPADTCTTEGQCVCKASCDGKSCGGDGCGGSCGSCPADLPACNEGICEAAACVPDCAGKSCGPDGCGANCGTCADADTCLDGVCTPPCVPDCADKVCGDNGCLGTCGVCADGLTCSDGGCKDDSGCVADCAGKDCGDDGCGGVCGWCEASHPACMAGQCAPYCADCTITGKVLAPEGSIPISGALVYASQTPPEPIPDHTYCDTCIDLSQGTVTKPFSFSTAAGDFFMNVPAVGDWYITVQKGQFRRVRKHHISAGGVTLSAEATTLPGLSDAVAGDTTPRMAVVVDSYDQIENTLDKLGLGDPLSGPKAFDTLDSYDMDLPEFFSTWENLVQYHIIFFPCDTDWFNPVLEDPAVQATLRKYVETGGKLYVTDWSYDILKEIFPNPITWLGDDGSPNSAQTGIYDAPVSLLNPGLEAWLGAQSIGAKFDLLANWTIVETVNAYEAPDAVGDMQTFQPTVWVYANTPEDGTRPATISFQYGCGRALFSTYHTEGDSGAALLPQELALIYTVLEVSVCTDTKANDEQ